MKPFLLLVLLTTGINLTIFSQSDSLKKKSKKQFYVTWGYTRAAYSRSTLHLKNLSAKSNTYTGRTDYYDFTLYDVTASDKPDFNKIKDVINVTIPQFVFRIGFTISDKWGFELNYDHTKYVVDDWQNARIKGQIEGHQINGDTILNPNKFLHFEHTDGANFWMFNAVRRWTAYEPCKNLRVSWVLKPGVGVVIPRTDVTLFGQELNNDWHLAGWIVGAEGGLRVEFFRNGFFEFVAKGSYADYMRCLVLGKGNGTANQTFFTEQLTATIGLKFNRR
jgi:hypothetical protein